MANQATFLLLYGGGSNGASSNLNHISHGGDSKFPSVPNDTVLRWPAGTVKLHIAINFFTVLMAGAVAPAQYTILFINGKLQNSLQFLSFHLMYGGGVDMPIHTSQLFQHGCNNDASFHVSYGGGSNITQAYKIFFSPFYISKAKRPLHHNSYQPFTPETMKQYLNEKRFKHFPNQTMTRCWLTF